MENMNMEIAIPDLDMWQQIGGDVSPGTYGGIIARRDGDALELIEIQPVREAVGDKEAANIGFPFWTKTGWYDLDDLDPNKDEVESALEHAGLDRAALEEMSPTQRALAIAEAMLQAGVKTDEGEAGWSTDIIHDKVKWSSGKVAGAEYLADDDAEFRRDILGEDEQASYTYTIFDADPNTSSGTAWPDHQEIEIEADDDDEAIDAVLEIMTTEAAGLNPDDGYDVGQKLYAIVWDGDTIVGEPTYELTAEDLDLEDEDDEGDD